MDGERYQLVAAAMAIVPIAIIIAATALGCGSPEPPAVRNVVLIVVDTLRRDHLGLYGYARNTMPSIDALASEGVRFDRAYATSGWTAPSVASMFTGLYPSGHGVVRPGTVLSVEVPTLAETLRDRGFATAGVVSNQVLGTRWGFGLARGFEVFDETNVRYHRGASTEGATATAIGMLASLSEGAAPFFLFVHYFDPHYNYERHREFEFAAATAGRLVGGEDISHLRDLPNGLTQEELVFLRDLYDGEIRYTDAGIGRLLEALRLRGHYDDTVIVFTADHGEEFMERGWLGHTRTLYDELVAVPLVLRLPRAAERAVVEEPVSLTSLPATIMELLGLPVPADFRNPSLVPQLIASQENLAVPAVLTEVDFVPAAELYAAKTAKQQSLVGPRFKLIRNQLTETVELYDVLQDPGERDDLSAREPARVLEMLSRLDALLLEARTHAHTSDEIELSKDQIEALRALGYGE